METEGSLECTSQLIIHSGWAIDWLYLKIEESNLTLTYVLRVNMATHRGSQTREWPLDYAKHKCTEWRYNPLESNNCYYSWIWLQVWGWADGSEFESGYCFYRESLFNSQNPCQLITITCNSSCKESDVLFWPLGVLYSLSPQPPTHIHTI